MAETEALQVCRCTTCSRPTGEILEPGQTQQVLYCDTCAPTISNPAPPRFGVITPPRRGNPFLTFDPPPRPQRDEDREPLANGSYWTEDGMLVCGECGEEAWEVTGEREAIERRWVNHRTRFYGTIYDNGYGPEFEYDDYEDQDIIASEFDYDDTESTNMDLRTATCANCGHAEPIQN